MSAKCKEYINSKKRPYYYVWILICKWQIEIFTEHEGKQLDKLKKKKNQMNDILSLPQTMQIGYKTTNRKEKRVQ